LNSGHARSKKVCQRSLGQGSFTSLRCTYMGPYRKGHEEHKECECRVIMGSLIGVAEHNALNAMLHQRNIEVHQQSQ
jgi:hypothetical protein